MANDTQAKELLKSLTEGLDFNIPNVDFDSDAFKIPDSLADALQKTPSPLTNETLTEGKVDGNGTFDVIMKAMKDHLIQEYKAGRITGAEYTKAYAAVMTAGLQSAVQYLLGRDAAYYGAIGAQAQALTQNLGIYKAKVELAIAQAQAHQNKADYANKVLNLANIDQQKELLTGQTSQVKEQTVLVTKQQDQTVAQTELLGEQAEQAHAQVSDTLRDGKTSVTGYTGNQNKLLQQQVISFKKDSIIKSAKIYADSFATQLSMSTATAAGTGLDANGIGAAISKLASSMDSN